jgi:septal ring factor EnvC (AmiA/AmiB activator)
MLRQQQAEIEALKKRVEEVKDTNGQLANLVQLHREEMEKMRQEILMWENAEVPTEVMADVVEELERRGFITK